MQAREPTSWRRKAPSNFPDRNCGPRFSIPPEPASASSVRNFIACLRHVSLHDNKTLTRSKCRGRVVLQFATRSSSSLSGRDRPARVRPSVQLWVVKVSSPWTSARCVLCYLPVAIVVIQGHNSDPQNSCLQEFNAKTAHINPGTPMPCRVTVRPDRTFHFEVRTPQTSWLLLNAAEVSNIRKGKRKGAAKPGHEVAGTVSLKHVYEIAKIKQSELRLSGLSLEGLCRSIIYQSRSMGINVVA